MNRYLTDGLKQFSVLFFLGYAFLGGYLIFFRGGGDPSFGMAERSVRMGYLLSILVAVSVSIHLLLSFVFVQIKGMSSTYSRFIPLAILATGLLVLPLNANNVLVFTISLSHFAYLGYLYFQVRISESPLRLGVHYISLCLISGVAFVLFPSLVVVLLGLLVVGWHTFKKGRFFHLCGIVIFYVSPSWLYALYLWLTEDTFVFLKPLSSAVHLMRIDTLLHAFDTLNKGQWILGIVLFLGMLVHYIYSMFLHKGLLVFHLVVLYFGLELLLFSPSIPYIWWNMFSLLSVLLIYWTVRTQYYRLLACILLGNALLFIH